MRHEEAYEPIRNLLLTSTRSVFIYWVRYPFSPFECGKKKNLPLLIQHRGDAPDLYAYSYSPDNNVVLDMSGTNPPAEAIIIKDEQSLYNLFHTKILPTNTVAVTASECARYNPIVNNTRFDHCRVSTFDRETSRTLSLENESIQKHGPLYKYDVPEMEIVRTYKLSITINHVSQIFFTRATPYGVEKLNLRDGLMRGSVIFYYPQYLAFYERRQIWCDRTGPWCGENGVLTAKIYEDRSPGTTMWDDRCLSGGFTPNIEARTINEVVSSGLFHL